MAPRAPDPPDALFARLREVARGGDAVVSFVADGHSHASHAVCLEGGRWRVRLWTHDPMKGQAYLKEHGHFWPENAEAIGEPGPDVLFEAGDVEGIIAALGASALV